MLYDLECKSQLGELGDFPVAKKDFQKLSREFIDLTAGRNKNLLVKNDLTLPKVIETCLRLVFTPYFYPFGIRRVDTVDNVKPLSKLIQETANIFNTMYQYCHHSYDRCTDCIQKMSDILTSNFPNATDITSYHELSKQIWININNIRKYNYLTITPMKS